MLLLLLLLLHIWSNLVLNMQGVIGVMSHSGVASVIASLSVNERLRV